ncbi:Holliday junction resolvase RuvX [Candidatus Profftia tarda]|nr:Holliday junction resolvase RuvX [Candidatus Profftia tarda]
MRNGTVLSFDFGTKNIGVAIGHKITGIARPLGSFKSNQRSPEWSKIKKILTEWHLDLVVVGLPLNIDGTEQLITVQARKFANRIHGRFGIEIALHDERFSTAEARSHILSRNNRGYRALKKSNIDAVSAVIILESWFRQQL